MAKVYFTLYVADSYCRLVKQRCTDIIVRCLQQLKVQWQPGRESAQCRTVLGCHSYKLCARLNQATNAQSTMHYNATTTT